MAVYNTFSDYCEAVDEWLEHHSITLGVELPTVPDEEWLADCYYENMLAEDVALDFINAKT